MGEKRFHYLKDGKPVGPISFAELKQLADANQVKPQDMVWPEGAPNWIPASEVEGLFTPITLPLSAPATVPVTPSEPAPTNRDALVDAAAQGFADGVKGAPPAGPDFLTTAKAGFVWLTTTLPGAGSLAVVGFLFLCCGGCGAVVSLTSQNAPTKHAIADLEDSAKTPSSTWMEISDGYLFWPEMVKDVSEVKKGDVVEKTTIRWYYIPLTSRSVVDDWEREFVRAGLSYKASYSRARVFLKISPDQMKKDFPDVASAGKSVDLATKKSPVKGTVGNFKSIPDHVMKGLKANAKNQDPDRMILLNYGEEISSSSTGVCVAIFLWLIGVPCLAPLGGLLFKRYTAARLAAK